MFFSVLPHIQNISVHSMDVIAEGDNVTITCECIGFPIPDIVWLRNNEILYDSDRLLISDTVNMLIGVTMVSRVIRNLTITNASREDTGVYTCIANNSVGSDNSDISITVQCKFVLFSIRSLYMYIVYVCMILAGMH